MTTLAKEKTKKCPKCGLTATGLEEIGDLFGLRWVDGRLQAQSWCYICRRAKPQAKPEIVEKPQEVKDEMGVGPVQTPPKLAADAVTIPTELKSMRALYASLYPGDKCKVRSWKFMAKKVVRKLGDKAYLSAAARDKLGKAYL